MLTLFEAARFLAGGYFIWTGSSKLGRSAQFWDAIMGYRLIGPRLSAVIASVVPPLEFVLGLFFAAGVYPRPSGAVLAVMLSAFTVAIAISLVRRTDNDCGCGPRRDRVRPVLLIRNLVLGALIALGFLAAQPEQLGGPSVAIGGLTLAAIASIISYRKLQK
ncbi:MAG: hypothetical protein JWN36_2109 [Microbacteriaceae bacterium]|nr:hypothetical protein [Microbacteriaceae bacterium]